MDELRMHHDEVTVVANRTGPGYNKGNDGNLHSLPVLGRFLLCFSGHMQFAFFCFLQLCYPSTRCLHRATVHS